jgi:hypothetical protein
LLNRARACIHTYRTRKELAAQADVAHRGCTGAVNLAVATAALLRGRGRCVLPIDNEYDACVRAGNLSCVRTPQGNKGKLKQWKTGRDNWARLVVALCGVWAG